MINLVVDDGTGLPDANSYVSLVEVRQFLLENGLDENDDDEDLSINLIRATNFIDSFESYFVGRRFTDTQRLAFPRANLCNSLHLYDSRNLKKAVCYAVDLLNQGVNLFPTKLTSDHYVKKEKLDVLEIQYHDNYFRRTQGIDMLGEFPIIANLMNGYIKSTGYVIGVSRG